MRVESERSCAGFTAATAAGYYATVTRRVAPAVPPPSLRQQVVNVWLDGATASGIPAGVDPLRTTATKPEFAGYTPLAADAQGRRTNSFTAYLAPVMHGACRHNLEVVQAAVVTRIVVEGGRATGVDYLCDISALAAPSPVLAPCVLQVCRYPN